MHFQIRKVVTVDQTWQVGIGHVVSANTRILNEISDVEDLVGIIQRYIMYAWVGHVRHQLRTGRSRQIVDSESIIDRRSIESPVFS